MGPGAAREFGGPDSSGPFPRMDLSNAVGWLNLPFEVSREMGRMTKLIKHTLSLLSATTDRGCPKPRGGSR